MWSGFGEGEGLGADINSDRTTFPLKGLHDHSAHCRVAIQSMRQTRMQTKNVRRVTWGVFFSGLDGTEPSRHQRGSLGGNPDWALHFLLGGVDEEVQNATLSLQQHTKER